MHIGKLQIQSGINKLETNLRLKFPVLLLAGDWYVGLEFFLDLVGGVDSRNISILRFLGLRGSSVGQFQSINHMICK